MLTASRRMVARVSASMKAPPPVASTSGSPASRRRITRRSPSRNSRSPKRSNSSAMVQPAASSISASASRKGRPSRAARRRPIEVLPAPISPTSTMLRPAIQAGSGQLSFRPTVSFIAMLRVMGAEASTAAAGATAPAPPGPESMRSVFLIVVLIGALLLAAGPARARCLPAGAAPEADPEGAAERPLRPARGIGPAVDRHLEAFLEMLAAERNAARQHAGGVSRRPGGFRRLRRPPRRGAGRRRRGRRCAPTWPALSAAGLSARTAARRLSALRQFHRFLLREGVRADDPTELLDAPKLPRGAAEIPVRSRRSTPCWPPPPRARPGRPR